MRTKIIGTARTVALTAGFVALGVGTTFPAGASADTSGDQSVLGGNQVTAPINIPIDACGNALALFGTADSSCKGGASAGGGGGGAARGDRTSGRGSIGGGNQATVPVNVPVNACGNAVAVFGSAASGCKGGAQAKPGGSGGGMGHRTSGEHSVLGGNQVHVPVTAPVDVCGNAIGNATAGCKGGARTGSGGKHGSGFGRTSGRGSVGGGNQVHVPVKVPVDVCGNAAGVLGDAAAACQGGGHGGGGGGYGHGGYGHGGSGDGSGYAGALTGSGTPLSGSGVGDAVAPKLPTVPGLTEVRPMDPAGTLPIVPELPILSPGGSSSGGSSSGTAPTTTTTTTEAAPARSRLPEPVNGLKGDVRHALKNTPVGKAPAQLPIAQDAQDAPHTMRPAAAGTPLSSGLTDDSLYVLALGALLAGASTVIAVTRRVRFGRR